MKQIKPFRLTFLTLLMVAWAHAGSQVWAHDQVPGAPQQQPILIKNATVHPVDAPVIPNGSVLFDDGKIVEVGSGIQSPDNTQTIDAQGMHVYPGLVESLTDLGLREISAVDATLDRVEYGDTNPNARAWVAFNPDSELIPVTRAGGVLLAHVVPGGNWIRGQTAVMQLDGWSVKEMKLQGPSGLYVSWRRMQPSGDKPESRARRREERFDELDQLLDEARRYAIERQANADTPSDVRLDSLSGLLRGELPLIVEADRRVEIESAIAYAEDQGLRLIIYGGYEAEACAELLKRYDVPVIVGGVYRLPLRRYDAYDAPYTLPARLHRAGIRYAIGGNGTGSVGGAANARNLAYHAATAVAFGLPPEDAIRGITLAAAEILGVADRVGSLTAGKDATLLVSDGDILQTEANVTRAWIQGREVDLSSKHRMLYEKYQQKYSRP